ncbi:MAG TPA: heme o synthase [Chloroflexota bacterium]|nr:heme o synthase [Chloroflexota bacterium]
MAFAASAPALPRTTDVAHRGAPPFQRLALAAAIFTYATIVMGAVVRVSDSGLGCPAWPTCYGSLVPPADVHAWIEWMHRTASAVASVLMLATTIAAWVWHRDERLMLGMATLVPILLPIQILIGSLVVLLELPAMAVLVHLGFGLAIFALLVAMTVLAGPPLRVLPATTSESGGRFRLLVSIGTGLIFVLILAGAYVQATGASWACVGFPDCNGAGVLPFGQTRLMDIQLLHRFLAFTAVALVASIIVEADGSQSRVPAMWPAVLTLWACILLQGAIGAVQVSIGVPAALQGLHVAGASATWAAMVVVAALTYRTRLVPTDVGTSAGDAGVGEPRDTSRHLTASACEHTIVLLRAHLALTKPRVMSLLLATTAATMFVAARGVPDLGLLVWTLVGGALMSGGAAAINHYIDRDIDPLMGRTASRPIPSGVIAPSNALWFGVSLGVAAFLVFAIFVNILSALLASIGLLSYVFVYSLWLKRSTPSNIVIGGAAGAIPPIVGWAAVTNEISSQTAWYLFAIVFFWTPPHFWALALLIKKHYARANVPMLPVVRGDDETRRQIVRYSLVLVAVSLVLSAFGLMGFGYSIAALVLGGVFIFLAVRLWREATPLAARLLYSYSILYLFALFTAMAVDRAVLE